MARHLTVRMWKQVQRANAHAFFAIGLFIPPTSQYTRGSGGRLDGNHSRNQQRHFCFSNKLKTQSMDRIERSHKKAMSATDQPGPRKRNVRQSCISPLVATGTRLVRHQNRLSLVCLRNLCYERLDAFCSSEESTTIDGASEGIVQ